MKRTLPDIYRRVPEAEILSRILDVKNRLKKRMVILTHHYQVQKIVELGDYRGDSYKLSATAAAQQDAEYIVFCGVSFMAESAAILAREDQMVFHPDLAAGCPMADMADIARVERAWAELSEVVDISSVVPITYINSTGAIKAFCGAREGCVVTSSNAAGGFKWGFDRAEKVMFLPDENLGLNTARKLGIPGGKVAVWDPAKERGGLKVKDIRKDRAIIWKGYCHVHTRFVAQDVKKVRAEYPLVRVVVHPECTPDVVELADAVGSTEYIIKYVKESPPGSNIAVGTELNLVSRLAAENPDKNIFELSPSVCPNMQRINLNNLCYTLENLPNVNRVIADASIIKDARKALQRMLEIK